MLMALWTNKTFAVDIGMKVGEDMYNTVRLEAGDVQLLRFNPTNAMYGTSARGTNSARIIVVER